VKPAQLVAKGAVIVLAGLLLGYFLGVSFAHDAARAHALTLKAYIDNFDNYKTELASSHMTMGVSLISGVIVCTLVFVVYELIALGLARGITAIDRLSSRRSDGSRGYEP
jgi:ABC-type glycerol-3-phosphate transport system permease component